MKKKLGLLLAAVMVFNTISSAAFAWENPLKSYNLYDDVTGGGSANDERERVMDDYNANSLRAGENGSPSDDLNFSNGGDSNVSVDIPKSRNETLRESSRNLYSEQIESVPAWEEGPSFYPNPSFDSIVEKYRRSDFAGCLQECISYVRQNPHDTLGFYYLAMCYTKVNDKDNAILAYERVIMLNDNPMIVKYATNGRNCIMGNEDEKCYENVNEPELVYPYANVVNTNLTPVDPETLVNRNLARLKDRLSPVEAEEDTNAANSKDSKNKKVKYELPFGKQDAELDKFIEAPYGNGLSPELNNEYKQLQLRKIKDTINQTESTNDKDYNNLNDIKKFDNQKSDSETIKLAYEIPSNLMDEISKDPEYIRQKQEMDELNMLLGNDRNNNNRNDMMDLLPYMSEQGDKKLSPEVIQSMMMQSIMGNLTL
ncbi:MAG: hypothetical protein K2F57_04365 [Candidatus Gastranaerophilales bacterium]|nr:hypothetical protein [Candidatus Gastranaerophilales bacterium]